MGIGSWFRRLGRGGISVDEKREEGIPAQPALSEARRARAFVRDIFDDLYDGDPYPDSFGALHLFNFVDYWALRKRSLQLFRENPYCIGIIRRLLLNEVHKGIDAEPMIVSSVLWPELKEREREDRAIRYGDAIDTVFGMYAGSREFFSHRGDQTFGEFQQTVRMESLLSGDGIIAGHVKEETGLIAWEWINGDNIQTPMDYSPPPGRVIKYGVEMESSGRHIAYHVRREADGGLGVKYERIPCYGGKSGRRLAWMVYGCEKLMDDVRGTPALACVLYMLKDLDRYRNAETRSAVINAMIAFYVYRPSDAPHGSNLTGKFRERLRGDAPLPPSSAPEGGRPGPQGEGFSIKAMEEGTVIDGLGPGEKLESMKLDRATNYTAFEGAIVNVLCWMLGIAPDMGKLIFHGTSATARQVNIELEIYLEKVVAKIGLDMLPIYEESVIQFCLLGLLDLPGFLGTVGDKRRWLYYKAWLGVTWNGLSRPSQDILKDVNAGTKGINACIFDFESQTKKLSGKPFRTVAMRLARQKAYLKELGLVSSVDENNNGEPALGQPEPSPPSEEEIEEQVEEAAEGRKEEGE